MPAHTMATSCSKWLWMNRAPSLRARTRPMVCLPTPGQPLRWMIMWAAAPPSSRSVVADREVELRQRARRVVELQIVPGGERDHRRVVGRPAQRRQAELDAELG